MVIGPTPPTPVSFGIATAPQQVAYADILGVWREADSVAEIEHADIWNVAGVDIDDAAARSALLDRYCADIGRDPGRIVRSTSVGVSYDDPEATRGAVAAAVGAGFTHIVLSLGAPYPRDVARWVADEIVGNWRRDS